MAESKQRLLPIVLQAESLAKKNVDLLNCWTGIATNERIDDNGFCNVCDNQHSCLWLYKLFAGSRNMHPAFLARKLARIFEIESEYMKSPAEIESTYKVIARDTDDEGNIRCLLCNKHADDVHEIMPRSWFGSRNKDECFKIENRCCLCRSCHNGVVSDEKRGELLYIMSQRYGYQYQDETRMWLIENHTNTMRMSQ